MREREEVEFAWRYRRWRALILATRERESQGGRGELGTCLEGIQEWITSRKRDLKKDHEASMSEDSSEFQGVEERRLFIFEKSALSYNHTRRWGSLREGCEG